MPLQGEYEPSTSEWVRDQVRSTRAPAGQGDDHARRSGRRDHLAGAGSGKLRKNPVMRVEHDGVYAAVASKGGAPENPAWYRNFVEHPLVGCRTAPHRADYTARENLGDERATWWERAVEVWPDYAGYQTKTEREIPVFLLEPAT